MYLVEYKQSNPKVNPVVLNRCMVQIHKKYHDSLQYTPERLDKVHK